jgi:hypothetical protein
MNNQVYLIIKKGEAHQIKFISKLSNIEKLETGKLQQPNKLLMIRVLKRKDIIRFSFQLFPYFSFSKHLSMINDPSAYLGTFSIKFLILFMV